jgi:hypothetical protein
LKDYKCEGCKKDFSLSEIGVKNNLEFRYDFDFEKALPNELNY